MEKSVLRKQRTQARPQPKQKNLVRGASQNRRNIIVFVVLTILIVFSIALYIFSRTYAHSLRLGIEMTTQAFHSIMGRTIPAMIGMAAAGGIIAMVSLAFQTITQSRILTPSMIGFDSVFIGTQTLLVFLFGAFTPFFMNPIRNFFVTSGVMVVISMLMFGAILRRGKNNIIFLLMFGLVLSGIVSNGARYIQSLMSFHDFYQVQAATAVTVMNMNTDVIHVAWPMIIGVAILMMLRHRTLDVMSLGAEQAKSLGVSYHREMNYMLVLVSVGMSVATAMIGTLTFLGLLVVNASRELLKTHKHLPLFLCSAGVAIFTLIMGSAIEQLLTGGIQLAPVLNLLPFVQVTDFTLQIAIPLTTIINLVGCSYVFYLILKENRL